MLFWQAAPPLREAVWLSPHARSGDLFVLFETRYSERQSLNPLNGTTLKRGYRAKLAVLRVPRDWPAGRRIPAEAIFADADSSGVQQSGGLEYQRLPDHAGWLLPDSLVRIGRAGGPASAGGLLPRDGFWLLGNAGDAYAGPERMHYHADAAGGLTQHAAPGGNASAAELEARRAAGRSSGSPAGRRLYYDDASGDFVLQID